MEHEPDNPSPIENANQPNKISGPEVIEMFDLLAEDYDRQCKELAYPGSTIVSDLIKEYLQGRDSILDVLDLGCGTGLLGRELREMAESLHGVDISTNMIRIAEAKELYDQLIVGDLVDHLRHSPQTYDLIVAMGTLHFFGDLTELLTVGLHALRPQGYLMFTVAYGPLMGDTYYYQPERYFTHGPQYVMQQLGELGICGGTIRRVKFPTPGPHSEYALVVAVERPEYLESNSLSSKPVDS